MSPYQVFGSHPDDPVILHRKELVNRRGPFVSLRDPAVNAAFDGELLGLMPSWDYTVISVCRDKQAHRQKYTVTPDHRFRVSHDLADDFRRRPRVRALRRPRHHRAA